MFLGSHFTLSYRSGDVTVRRLPTHRVSRGRWTGESLPRRTTVAGRDVGKLFPHTGVEKVCVRPEENCDWESLCPCVCRVSGTTHLGLKRVHRYRSTQDVGGDGRLVGVGRRVRSH